MLVGNPEKNSASWAHRLAQNLNEFGWQGTNHTKKLATPTPKKEMLVGNPKPSASLADKPQKRKEMLASSHVTFRDKRRAMACLPNCLRVWDCPVSGVGFANVFQGLRLARILILGSGMFRTTLRCPIRGGVAGPPPVRPSKPFPS